MATAIPAIPLPAPLPIAIGHVGTDYKITCVSQSVVYFICKNLKYILWCKYILDLSSVELWSEYIGYLDRSELT